MDIGQKIYNALGQHLGYLRDRWSDESEYEDWNDYVESIKKKIAEVEGVEFVWMKKRPFAVMCKAEDGTEIEVRATAKAIKVFTLAPEVSS